MNPYRALVQALGTTRGFAWVASRVLPPLDARFAGRRRSVTSFGTGFPLCFLTTTGRRTHERRTVPLLYVADGERLVVFASNWGKRSHPAWALNLEAEPQATVAIDSVTTPVTGRRATGEEQRRLWPEADRIYPGYAGYRARAGREIRIFVLEPSGPAEARAPIARL
jgi:deazaflavin-dependent oxidoreductase (nitroreductase family)